MSKKENTLLKLLSPERKKIEERIQALLIEKEVLDRKIRETKLEKLAVGLKHEKEELEERIESLQKEKEDVILHRKVVEIIGELQCPKDFLCYKSEYEKLCKAGFNGNQDILHCLEVEPDECIFSLSLRNTYYCQCPLRNFIAVNIDK